MLLKLYSVYDAKAEVFNSPFTQKTHGEAERTFKQLCTDPKTMMSQYPDDFDMYYLGEFDSNTGKCTLKATPEHMVKAIQMVDRTGKQTPLEVLTQ